MNLAFSDPMIPFNEAFSKLLGPKTLMQHRGFVSSVLRIWMGSNEFDIESPEQWRA